MAKPRKNWCVYLGRITKRGRYNRLQDDGQLTKCNLTRKQAQRMAKSARRREVRFLKKLQRSPQRIGYIGDRPEAFLDPRNEQAYRRRR